MEKGDILAQRSARLRPVRQVGFGLLLLGLPALGVVTAFGVAPGAVVNGPELTTIREVVALPDFALESAPPTKFVTQ